MSWLSRITVTQGERLGECSIGTLRAYPYRQHQLLWKLFEAPKGASQPFLFRQVLEGADMGLRFLLVSQDRPREYPGLLVESKPYDPQIREGERFYFSARLNPTRTEKRPGGRGKRQDYVISRLHQLQVGKGERAAMRQHILNEELPQWLMQRAEKRGFLVESCVVERYEHVTTAGRGNSVSYSVADFSGVLRATESEKFRQVLFSGIGHAKAFGCGLLLLKRVE